MRTPPPLAKSGRSGFDHAVNAGYRHEFGSLLDLLRKPTTSPVTSLHTSWQTITGTPVQFFGLERQVLRRMLARTPHRRRLHFGLLGFTRTSARGSWHIWRQSLKAADALASREGSAWRR